MLSLSAQVYTTDSGLFTWYRNDFHSGTSSFHLHVFLYICSHDTETKLCSCTSRISSFRISFRMKFWSCRYKISFLYPVNRKRTSIWIENRKSCSLGCEWCMRIWSGTKITSAWTHLRWAVRFYHVNAVRSLLANKTHSRMKIIPVS